MKKILVVYYSRTGHTKKIAEEISKNLNADIDEIIDKKKRKGFIRFLSAGREALRGNLTEIEFNKKTEDYDLVVIGTPTWAGTIPPAIRTYLSKNKPKNIAFFCTHGSETEGKVFEELEKLSNKPLATLSLRAKDVDSSDEKTKDFCERLK